MSTIAYWITWLFVFALPWENAVSVIPGTAIVTKVTGALSLAAALGATVLSGRLRRWHPMHLVGLMFLIWAGAELFVTHFGNRLPYKYTTYAQLFAVVLIIWEIAPSWSRLTGLMLGYVLGGYVAALATLMLYRQAGSELKRFTAMNTRHIHRRIGFLYVIPRYQAIGSARASVMARLLGSDCTAVKRFSSLPACR